MEDPFDNSADDEISGEVDLGRTSDDDLPPTPPRPSTPPPARGLPWTPKVRLEDVHASMPVNLLLLFLSPSVGSKSSHDF